MKAPERHRSTWRFVVAYHGARFSGWQKQAGARTVQGVLEEALFKLSGDVVTCRAAGRTDSGVHARGQLVSARFTTRVPPHKMVLACGSQLPDDVAVLRADVVDDDFDARRDSIAKRYIYRVHNHSAWDPFEGPLRWHVRGRNIDTGLMQREAQVLVGEHDFESFRSAQCDSAHARRFLWKVAVAEDGPLIAIEVRGNAFCRNMVRIIAGTLVDIGRGRLPPGTMQHLLDVKHRSHAGITAPPQGLTLEQVYLPEDGVAAGIPAGAVFPGWPHVKRERRPVDDDVVSDVNDDATDDVNDEE